MKHIIAITVAAFVSISAHAQWIVYDPISNVQQILDQAENIAEYVDMVDNQVQQIQQLTQQLQQLQQYNKVFGDPSQILNVIGANQLVSDLDKTVVGQSLGAVQNLSQGIDAMTFDANGLYHNIGTAFQTPSGNSIQREDDIYRENAAIQTATENFTNVFNDVTQRRLSLRADIATTIQQLQSATTASEVQKLTGVLVGQESDLADTDKEIDQAASLTVVQDAENRNDADKQAKARLEEQQAEFTEAITNYSAAFKPASEAPSFPDQ
jgi:hypothetical protein